MRFPRQEYWRGLPCPPPEDLPDPGIESTSLMSPAFAGKFLTTCHLGSLRWHIKKQTHHFADKGLYSQSYGFSNSHVWCKTWTINKAESWRIDAFELWGWRRLLRVPWTARKTDQSILIGINCEYSLEGLMLKLKLQYFGHLMWRANSLEKTLMMRKIEGKRRRERQRMRWLDSIIDSMDMN